MPTGHSLHQIRLFRGKTAVSVDLVCDDTKTALRSCRTVGCCYDSGHFQGKLNKFKKEESGVGGRGRHRRRECKVKSTEIKIGQTLILDQ